MPPREFYLDPRDNESSGSEDDPTPSSLTQLGDAWVVREGYAEDYHDVEDVDPEVARIQASHDAELARITGVPIRADHPEFPALAHERRVEVYRHQKTIPAVGAEPEGGFLEPVSEENYSPAPKLASGFAVVRKGRKR